MQKKKLSFEESLEKEVVSTNKCVGCAGCVVVCPFKCLVYEGTPKLAKKCEVCGICPQICPKYNWSMPEAEEYLFGRSRRKNEEFGIYRRMVIAQASDKDIVKKCQDGGAVTALFTQALKSKNIEGVALSGLSAEKPLCPQPMLATNPNQVLENAGTRYSYSANLLALQEGIKLKKKSLAFVGTPCQIHALRRIQMFPLKKYSNPLQFTVGLMCTESFTYDGFFEKHLKKDLGINLKNIRKVNIKGKILVTLESGEEKKVSLSTAKQYTRTGCHHCRDFSAELADISAGGLGLNGWTFIILRTQKGEEIFNGAVNAGFLRTKPVEEEPFARSLLTKLSKKKQLNS